MNPAVVVNVDLFAVTVGAIAIGGSLWLRSRWLRNARRGGADPLLADLELAQRKVRHFAESQGQFVASLAEEIRAPLATAQIHAELLLASSREPATVERYAKSLAGDVRHLSGMVESFLRLAQPLAQEDTSKHVPVHVHDLVLAAARRCRFLASTRDVTIVPTLAQTRDGSPVEVLGDAVLLEAMLENLIRNGVLSSPRGGRVELRVNLVGEEVHVAVLDRGEPVATADTDEVLHGYFAVPGPTRASFGTSLSLAIAMRVAEHHRGTIALAHAPETGCRFEVHLPRWSGGDPLPA